MKNASKSLDLRPKDCDLCKLTDKFFKEVPILLLCKMDLVRSGTHTDLFDDLNSQFIIPLNRACYICTQTLPLLKDQLLGVQRIVSVPDSCTA